MQAQNDDDPQERKDAEESAAEWGERQARETRNFRLGCGAVIGLAAGMMLFLRYFNAATPWYVFLLIVGGCILAFAKALAEGDDKAGETLGWLLFPEFKILSGIPWWLMIVILVVLLALLFGFAAILLFARTA